MENVFQNGLEMKIFWLKQNLKYWFSSNIFFSIFRRPFTRISGHFKTTKAIIFLRVPTYFILSHTCCSTSCTCPRWWWFLWIPCSTCSSRSTRWRGFIWIPCSTCSSRCTRWWGFIWIPCGATCLCTCPRWRWFLWISYCTCCSRCTCCTYLWIKVFY